MDTSTCAEPESVTSVSLVRDFQVRHQGRVVDVSPTAQRLVCFLALNPYPVRRPYVSGVLWPDADERHASASLRSALWRVPSPGGQQMVETSRTHVWLHAAVDVDLRGLIRQGTTMLATGAAAPWTDVAHVLRLYGHDLLTGWYDDWAVAEREHFRQIRLAVLDQVGERLTAAGRHQEALILALAVVAAEPLRESAQRLLVRIHLQEGNLGEAFRVYDTYAGHLRRELGGEPSAAMTGLMAPYRCRDGHVHATDVGTSARRPAHTGVTSR